MLPLLHHVFVYDVVLLCGHYDLPFLNRYLSFVCVMSMCMIFEISYNTRFSRPKKNGFIGLF